MSVPVSRPWSVLLGLVFAAWLCAQWLVVPAASQSAAAVAAVKWEYKADTVEANSVQAKLSDLSNEGWDVFSLIPMESRLDPGNGTPKVIVEKCQITSRKPLNR